MVKQVLVIGAGASGLTAAVTAARRGCSVTVFDCNDRIGKKLLATGNGRCNYTNERMTPGCFRSETPEAVREVISRFGTEAAVSLLRSLGIEPLVKNGYYYPASGQAASVTAVFDMELKQLGVRRVLGQRVTSVKKQKNGFAVTAGEQQYIGSAVILACGSNAGIPERKAAGGYELARKLGHSLTVMAPGLTGLRCTGDWFGDWSGVRTDGRIRIRSGMMGEPAQKGQLLAEDTGELQLTDYGVSGIPAFQVSRFAAMALAKGRRVQAEIDFFPQLSRDGLLSLLIDRQKRMKYKSSRELLVGLVPEKLIPVFQKQAADRSLSAAAACMKSLTMAVTAVNPMSQAQVCAGGIRLTEINCSTMESRLVPGLYLTGEMLDADGICGGYNLQWAWATGAIAGKSVL